MPIDLTKDIDSLEESDLSGLSADELKILARLAEHEPIYVTRALDPTATLMEYVGDGSPKRAHVAAGSIAVALIKGWTKV